MVDTQYVDTDLLEILNVLVDIDDDQFINESELSSSHTKQSKYKSTGQIDLVVESKDSDENVQSYQENCVRTGSSMLRNEGEAKKRRMDPRKSDILRKIHAQAADVLRQFPLSTPVEKNAHKTPFFSQRRRMKRVLQYRPPSLRTTREATSKITKTLMEDVLDLQQIYQIKLNKTSLTSLQLTKNDVICGRGPITDNMIGNKRFKALINAHQIPHKVSEPHISKAISVVQAVFHSTPSGRFMTLDLTTGLWRVLTTDESVQATLKYFEQESESGLVDFMPTTPVSTLKKYAQKL